ncbi:DUF262 domain-containing protein [Planctomycetales bacterium 10988]|nr:DUF262 domain-containing protein [Planctomycetales bacterium 10988]
MKATEAKLLEFLKKSPQFIIPIYQRTYSWTKKECLQLWNDLLRTGGNSEISAHFVGSIVYIEKGLYQVSSQTPLLVIDGQQRLTTITLLLEALARHLGDAEPVDGFSARKLRNYYLLNPLEDGERGFKLLLTQTDKATLLSLVQQKPQSKEKSIRIEENFEFFMEQLDAIGEDLVALCNGLAKLIIVDVSLNRDQDNPQLIFESMNSTGRELSQADLIRNYILMGLEPKQQTELYSDHWRPMEIAFGQEAYGSHFDKFMRHYLTLKTGEIPKLRAIYEAFKEYARTPEMVQLGVKGILTDIHRFADYYCAMALSKETDKTLAAAFQDLSEMKVDVAYPFLLVLYYDYAKGLLSKEDFVKALRFIEAYVFRRAVCSIPTNSLNKIFANFSRVLKKDRYLESIQAHLLLRPSYRRFPSDDEFMRELKVRDLYSFPRRSYLLRRMENYGRKEFVPVDEYTIEHILPQNPNLSTSWKEALGSDWKRVHKTWLHTLGNLTLTGYNSEYSDRSFQQKRDMQGGFKESPLKLNEGLSTFETWNEDAIKQRAEKLAHRAVEVWASPELSEETLEKYQPKVEKVDDYTIEDHPFLATDAPMRPLFDALRKETLALDPCVSEEFRKLYVAYKAETNFLDIIPRKSKLTLSINLPFHEVIDPQGICKNVSNQGRWGNGDVEVGFNKEKDLPYVLGLIRQAFEKQMGDTDQE